ncbi:hypothetical protein [Chitinophaga sp.]|uniref:hypothetical protein n=1 Tax=Chitinophaga sp. TaxID=1869181 RepID=UPI0031D96122
MATFITIPEEDNEELLKNDAPGSWPNTPEERAEWNAFSEAVRQSYWRTHPIKPVVDYGKIGFNTIAK